MAVSIPALSAHGPEAPARLSQCSSMASMAPSRVVALKKAWLCSAASGRLCSEDTRRGEVWRLAGSGDFLHTT